MEGGLLTLPRLWHLIPLTWEGVFCCPLESGGFHDRLPMTQLRKALEAPCRGVLLSTGPAVHLCTPVFGTEMIC